MSKKKRPVPKQIIIGTDRYELTLLRVQSRHEDGRPEFLQVIGMDQTCELSKNPDENHFHMAYVMFGNTNEHAGKIPTI